MKCKRSNDGRAVDKSAAHALRMQAIKAVRNGRTVADVADAFGINERTLYRWLSRYAEGGQKALHSKPKSGRPRKLTPEEMRWVARTVRDENPQQLKLPYALWTLSLIQELIERHLGKKLSRASVHNLMKTLGFSAQKPLYQAWQRDPELVRQWETETYPEIRKQAKREGATIYFADESGLRSDYHTGTTWSPVGETPVVEATGRRFAVNMISAVSPRGEMRFMVHQGTVNAQVFREFLRRLLVGAERPVFVIVDGHPAHKAKLVREFVESTDGMLKLFFLPPYSPQLNPDEQVWAHVKREIGRRGVQNVEQMKRMARSALWRLQKLPALIQSFFRQPECQYARA
ncbi:IS630 family transposase [Halorhodospira halophila]|uniref:IS630 family transposase n=1 Tax=Halorhodospira halophila TaxID=1053 RepID=UPI001913FF74|nr:IS630 family transposase [Halorhodospira halophila]MBK5936400.1 IS630 family transposase [Halorhodospira halophila]